MMVLMARPERLGDEAIADALSALQGWEYREGSLCRDFAFGDFVEAFAFMTQVAMEAEKHNHHPDWENVYSRVRVRLNTHDVGGVTSLDVDLARAMDGFFSRYDRG